MRLSITKILIADDQALVRAGIRGQLRALGNETAIIGARDWVEAMAAAAVHPNLGLALIDLRMPGKEGLTTLLTLSIRPEWHLLKAIVRIFRHSRASGNPGGLQNRWILACAGMTGCWAFVA